MARVHGENPLKITKILFPKDGSEFGLLVLERLPEINPRESEGLTIEEIFKYIKNASAEEIGNRQISDVTKVLEELVLLNYATKIGQVYYATEDALRLLEMNHEKPQLFSQVYGLKKRKSV